jgi:opacity protein-like surface antigen
VSGTSHLVTYVEQGALTWASTTKGGTMPARDHSLATRPRRTRRLAGGLIAVALAGALASAAVAPASAAPERAAPASAKLQGCGWNEAAQGEHAYYEHCASDTNVWIQVTRWARGGYHRCVGPGRTNLDYDATGAWYDSTFRGGLCSHPGDTA